MNNFRSTMRRILLTVVIALMPLAASAQDFDKGLAAARAGDYETALKEWRPLAEQGHPGAQFCLGVMYEAGEGVPRDKTEAARWYRMAAEFGLARAQVNLGLMCYRGQGVPKDYAEAAQWFRLAGEQGDADGQYNLGVAYEKGQGVPNDHDEAVRLYRLAASQGNTLGQIALGNKYFGGGRGTRQSFVLSYMWYHIAGENGDEKGSENREMVATSMTPEQIEEAQHRARVCMESNYKECD